MGGVRECGRSCWGARRLPHLSVLLHHDVGVVPISNAEDEGRNAITRTRPGEQVDGPVVPDRSREDVRQEVRKDTVGQSRKKGTDASPRFLSLSQW